jgi:hypothetical protein
VAGWLRYVWLCSIDSFRFRGSQSLFVYHTNKNCKGVSAISKKQGALRRLAGAVTTALAVGMAGFFTLCLADAGLNGELAALRPRHGAMRFAHCAYDCPFSKKTGKYRRGCRAPLFLAFRSAAQRTQALQAPGHIKKRPVPWKPQRVHARVSVKCHRVPSFKPGTISWAKSQLTIRGIGGSAPKRRAPTLNKCPILRRGRRCSRLPRTTKSWPDAPNNG